MARARARSPAAALSGLGALAFSRLTSTVVVGRGHVDGDARGSWVAASLRDSPNLFIPVMLDIILVFSGNEVLESPSDPFVSVHLFGLLFVVHGLPMVVLEVILELFVFLELFEEKLVELILARTILGVHTFEDPVEQLQESLDFSVAEPLDLHQMGHVKIALQSTIRCTVLENVLYPLSARDIRASFFGLAQLPQHSASKSRPFAHAVIDELFLEE